MISPFGPELAFSELFPTHSLIRSQGKDSPVWGSQGSRATHLPEQEAGVWAQASLQPCPKYTQQPDDQLGSCSGVAAHFFPTLTLML